MDQSYIPFRAHTTEQQIVLIIPLIIQEDSLVRDIQAKVDIEDNSLMLIRANHALK